MKTILTEASIKEVARAKAFLEEHGQEPTPKAVEAVIYNGSYLPKAERKAFFKQLAEEEEKLGRRVAGMVALYTVKAGKPPLQAEIRSALMKNREWGIWEARMTLLRLLQQGWLTCTDEPRSLRPGPKITEGKRHAA